MKKKHVTLYTLIFGCLITQSSYPWLETYLIKQIQPIRSYAYSLITRIRPTLQQAHPIHGNAHSIIFIFLAQKAWTHYKKYKRQQITIESLKQATTRLRNALKYAHPRKTQPPENPQNTSPMPANQKPDQEDQKPEHYTNLPKNSGPTLFDQIRERSHQAAQPNAQAIEAKIQSARANTARIKHEAERRNTHQTLKEQLQRGIRLKPTATRLHDRLVISEQARLEGIRSEAAVPLDQVELAKTVLDVLSEQQRRTLFASYGATL